MVMFLSSDDIAQILTPRLCLDALEEAFADLSERRAATMIGREMVTTRLAQNAFPDTRSGNAYYSLESQMGIMPRYGVGVVRIKSDIMHWRQTDEGIRRTKVAAASGHRYCGLVLLFHIETCEPLAVMPDGLIQRMRVGATSALGAKYLARPDAKSVGLIGAGWQAGAQLLTVVEVRPIERIKVFSPSVARREAFAAEMRNRLRCDVEPVDSPLKAASGAEILHSATNSRAPTLTAELVEPGMHLGAISVEEVGQDVLDATDICATSQRLRLASYHWAIANGSAAHIREREFEQGWWRDEALWDRFVELGDLITGRAGGRRRTAEEVTLCVSAGAGIQFAAVGAKVLDAATQRGLGTEVPVDWFLQRDPS